MNVAMQVQHTIYIEMGSRFIFLVVYVDDIYIYLPIGRQCLNC